MNASAKQVAVVRAKLKFANQEEFLQGFAPLLSPAGLFVRTKNSKAEGTPVRFEFRLADDTPIFVGEGVVRKQIPFDPARPKRPCGMLVGLRKLNRQSKDILDEVLRRKADAHSTRPTAGQAQVPDDVPDLTDMATPPAPVQAAGPGGTAVPGIPPVRGDGPPLLPVPEAETILDMATPPAPVEAMGIATQDELPSQELEEPAAAPEAEPGSASLFAAPAPEGPPVEGGLFDGLDEGFDLFGSAGLDDELDELFASAGMVTTGGLDIEGPADLAGSAIPLFNVASTDDAHADEGGGLLNFDDEDLDDEEDFFDLAEPQPQAREDADEPGEEPPSRDAFAEAEPQGPQFAFAPAESEHGAPDYDPQPHGLEEPSFDAPAFEPQAPVFAAPALETPAFGTQAQGFEVPPAYEPQAPKFLEPSFDEPSYEPQAPGFEAPAVEAPADRFDDFGVDADLVEELDPEPEPAPPRVMLPPPNLPPVKLPPPPRLAPPPSTELGEVLSHLDDDQPVTPLEESGLIKTPSILSEPAIDVAAMAARADDAALSSLVNRGDASRFPSPPGGVNPLDSVSITNSELPPPPKPTGFSSPSLDTLDGAKGKKKGLFNKLFGKE